MHVSPLVYKKLQNVDEGLDYDLVKEFFSHTHFLFLSKGLIKVVVVRLVS